MAIDIKVIILNSKRPLYLAKDGSADMRSCGSAPMLKAKGIHLNFESDNPAGSLELYLIL